MPRRSVSHVHAILLQMIRQDFSVSSQPSSKDMDVDKGHVWEVRHAGLLGIKYEVAVRSDLFEGKSEEGDFGLYGKEVLSDVADAAILGYVIQTYYPYYTARLPCYLSQSR
jgi:TATA-binding protein-associated factor